MRQTILTLNPGSSSLKFALFDAETRPLLRGSFEKIRGTHSAKLHEMKRRLKGAQPSLVGVRIVHGGSFREAVAYTPAVEQRLKSLVPLAPLHQGAGLNLLRSIRQLYPRARRAVAFDTAFFVDLPAEAKQYAIPSSVARRYGIRRFGFHGLSHEWAMEQAALRLGKPVEQLKLITLHLGSGASAAAIDRGHPIETSMGLTPMEGLVMATRSGDLDPGIVFHLARAGWPIQRIESVVNSASGWKGIAGTSDFRELLVAAGLRKPDAGRKTIPASRRQAAGLALDMSVHRIVKYIGAYHALLGGADAIVCTGSIGAGSAPLRRILNDWLRPLGLPEALAIPTDEEALIARSVLRFLP